MIPVKLNGRQTLTEISVLWRRGHAGWTLGPSHSTGPLSSGIGARSFSEMSEDFQMLVKTFPEPPRARNLDSSESKYMITGRCIAGMRGYVGKSVSSGTQHGTYLENLNSKQKKQKTRERKDFLKREKKIYFLKILGPKRQTPKSGLAGKSTVLFVLRRDDLEKDTIQYYIPVVPTVVIIRSKLHPSV